MSETESETAKVETETNNQPRCIMSEVFRTIRTRGYDVMSVEDLETPEHTDMSGGLTPEWSNDARLLDNAGVFDHMDITDALDGVFGEPTGSSHVTSVFVRAAKTVSETVELLDNRGHIEAAINKAVDHESPDGIELTDAQKDDLRTRAVDMVGYKVAEHSKGWVAEKTLTGTDTFSKASMSNDLGGQDAYDTDAGEYVQVKSVTLGYKPNGSIVKNDSGVFETTKNNVPVVFYQWDCDGGIWYGRDHKEVNKKATDVKGHKATTAARTHSAYTYDGRTYRKLWW